MSTAAAKLGIEITGKQPVGELEPIDFNARKNVSPLTPFIQKCTMCHSIWDYYSEMTECPKCKTKFKVVSKEEKREEGVIF